MILNPVVEDTDHLGQDGQTNEVLGSKDCGLPSLGGGSPKKTKSTKKTKQAALEELLPKRQKTTKQQQITKNKKITKKQNKLKKEKTNANIKKEKQKMKSINKTIYSFDHGQYCDDGESVFTKIACGRR